MPTLVIGEHSFECRPNLPQWRLMELAAAVRSNDEMAAMAGMHNFVLAVIQPDERERFTEAMHELDDTDGIDALDEAIGNLMVAYSAPDKGAASTRPTRRSSASPSGQTRTGGMSRVVSLQRGTVKVVETRSSPGHSAAS